MQQEHCAGQPGGQSTPAKPEQSAWCDVFGDAGTTGAAIISGGIGQGRHLNEVEIVQQAYPDYSGENMQPDHDGINGHRRGHMAIAGDHDNDDGQHEAANDRASYTIQWIHVLFSQRIISYLSLGALVREALPSSYTKASGLL